MPWNATMSPNAALYVIGMGATVRGVAINPDVKVE